MKKLGILIFIVLLIFITIYNNEAFGYSSIEKCFKSTGANFMCLTVEGRAIVKTNDSPYDTAFKILKSIKNDKEVKINNDNDFVELYIKDKGNDIKIRANNYEKDEIYVCITYSHYDGIVNINNIRRTINSCFSIFNTQPSFYSLIEGKFNKIMGNDEMKNLAQTTILKSKSKIINGMEDRNLVSFYGYNPYIKDKIDVEKNLWISM